MIVRFATFEGTVPEADRAEFDSIMREQAMPIALESEHVLGARYLKAETEGAERGCYCATEMYFPSMDGLRAFLASPVRTRVRETMAPALARFDGRIVHINFQVDTLKEPPRG